MVETGHLFNQVGYSLSANEIDIYQYKVYKIPMNFMRYFGLRDLFKRLRIIIIIILSAQCSYGANPVVVPFLPQQLENWILLKEETSYLKYFQTSFTVTGKSNGVVSVNHSAVLESFSSTKNLYLNNKRPQTVVRASFRENALSVSTKERQLALFQIYSPGSIDERIDIYNRDDQLMASGVRTKRFQQIGYTFTDTITGKKIAQINSLYLGDGWKIYYSSESTEQFDPRIWIAFIAGETRYESAQSAFYDGLTTVGVAATILAAWYLAPPAVQAVKRWWAGPPPPPLPSLASIEDGLPAIGEIDLSGTIPEPGLGSGAPHNLKTPLQPRPPTHLAGGTDGNSTNGEGSTPNENTPGGNLDSADLNNPSNKQTTLTPLSEEAEQIKKTKVAKIGRDFARHLLRRVGKAYPGTLVRRAGVSLLSAGGTLYTFRQIAKYVQAQQNPSDSGLPNLGNTCYLNAVMAALAAHPRILEMTAHLVPIPGEAPGRTFARNQFRENFRALMLYIQENPESVSLPRYLAMLETLQNLLSANSNVLLPMGEPSAGLQAGRQFDADEYLRHVLVVLGYNEERQGIQQRVELFHEGRVVESIQPATEITHPAQTVAEALRIRYSHSDPNELITPVVSAPDQVPDSFFLRLNHNNPIRSSTVRDGREVVTVHGYLSERIYVDPNRPITINYSNNGHMGDPRQPAQISMSYLPRSIIVHRGVIVEGWSSGHWVSYVRRGQDWYLYDDQENPRVRKLSPSEAAAAFEGEIADAGKLVIYSKVEGGN